MTLMPICPFCGVATDAVHETQEACIDALQAEIARVRAVLTHVTSVDVPGPPPDDSEDDPES